MLQYHHRTILVTEAEFPPGDPSWNGNSYYTSLAFLSSPWYAFRHFGGNNTLFADGHVKWVTVSEYYWDLLQPPVDYHPITNAKLNE
jgi:prepilin-type processing-associated H-X9-DG protein